MRSVPSPAHQQRAALTLAAALGAAGVLHLARPQLYAGLIPRGLGPWRPWVLGSGVAQLVCAGLLGARRSRQLGAAASAARLVAELPGNVEMALRLNRRGGLRRTLAWLRVPLQVPLVLWALRAGGWALRR